MKIKSITLVEYNQLGIKPPFAKICLKNSDLKFGTDQTIVQKIYNGETLYVPSYINKSTDIRYFVNRHGYPQEDDYYVEYIDTEDVIIKSKKGTFINLREFPIESTSSWFNRLILMYINKVIPNGILPVGDNPTKPKEILKKLTKDKHLSIDKIEELFHLTGIPVEGLAELLTKIMK